MRKLLILFAGAVLICLPAEVGLAANPMSKLGRGLTNIAFSPMEYPTNIQKIGDRKGFASGLFEGLLTGTYFMLGRLLTGSYDVVSFLVPIPRDYGPLMKPEYVFEAVGEA